MTDTVRRDELREALEAHELNNFNRVAAHVMRERLDHGARKFGALSWRRETYTDADNIARLRRAVDHLVAALANWRRDDATLDAAVELPKRAADVANQAFMLADPLRREGTAALAAPAAEPREEGRRATDAEIEAFRAQAYDEGTTSISQRMARIAADWLVAERAAAQPGPSEPGLREAMLDSCARGFHQHDRSLTCLAAADSAPGERLLDRIKALIDDEPRMEGVASEGVRRWYSEGWNRLARDIRAALAEKHQEDGEA